MIPYYSAHLCVLDIIRSLFVRDSEKKIINFFTKYTGKKHILITASCRSALYLSYRVLNKQGLVITSPLTCESAIEPIFWSQNRPLFADIDFETLNMDENCLESLMTLNPIAIQLINHGGFANKEKQISLIAKRYHIPMIADCAQSFGATVDQRNSGYFADIACYSLIKNAYGIGGGILATDAEEVYTKAREIQNKFRTFSQVIVIYRILYNYLETTQGNIFFGALFRLLVKIKLKQIKKRGSSFENNNCEEYLFKPAKRFAKLFVSRISKMYKLQLMRKQCGKELISKLIEFGIAENYRYSKIEESSFTKLFIFNRGFESQRIIEFLKQNGVDAKHLEQRDDARVQNRFDRGIYLDYNSNILRCKNYLIVHGSLVSIPVIEYMAVKHYEKIINAMKKYIYENNLVRH